MKRANQTAESHEACRADWLVHSSPFFFIRAQAPRFATSRQQKSRLESMYWCSLMKLEDSRRRSRQAKVRHDLAGSFDSSFFYLKQFSGFNLVNVDSFVGLKQTNLWHKWTQMRLLASSAFPKIADRISRIRFAAQFSGNVVDLHTSKTLLVAILFSSHFR